MAVIGRVGQKEGLTVKPDQAVVAEPPHGALNSFLVADLPAHFGHRAVVRVTGQRKGEDRPLRAFVFARLVPNTLCLHGELRLLVPGARTFHRRGRHFVCWRAKLARNQGRLAVTSTDPLPWRLALISGERNHFDRFRGRCSSAS